MIGLRAHGLGKAYRLYDRPIDSLRELVLRRPCHRTLWALRDVDFALPQGGSLGVIGDNGAGKTTLLKLLAGTIEPTTGSVHREGRVSAILELGAGFDPELSGLENIRIGCAVGGLSSGQTERLVPKIIEFSELQRFIDRPVKTYSSGMNLRLGFSVATMVDPQVLIIDEHLAVGDQHFRKKCMNRIADMMRHGVTLVLCSHDLHALREVCETGLWLRDGQVERLGPIHDVLEAYQDHVRALDGLETAVASSDPDLESHERSSADDTRITRVELGGDCRDGEVNSGGALVVHISACLAPAAREEGVHVGLLITRNDNVWVYGVSTALDGLPSNPLVPTADGQHGIDFVVPSLPLLAGQYSLTVALMDGATPHLYDTWKGVAPFRVRQQSLEVGLTGIAHCWRPPGSR